MAPSVSPPSSSTPATPTLTGAPSQDPSSHDSKQPKKPCRVCSDFKTWAKIEKKPHSTASSTPSSKLSSAPSTATTSTSTAATVGSQSSSTTPDKPYEPFPCPPDSLEVGRATWTFLHTMAAYYPSTPTTDEKSSMTRFFTEFAKFYPCGYCASHLRQELVSRPPQVNSNGDLSKWLCDIHNEVNERLGKPKFDCSRALERWRDGPKDGSCD